jgi:HNH endonuclease
MANLCECGCGKEVKWDKARFSRGHNLNAHRPAEDRFWDQVVKVGKCWEWKSTYVVRGYGLFGLKPGTKILAHRFSYELLCGPIPEGLWVLHHCDNRRCVNPTHLFIGDAADNVQDMMNKGRNVAHKGEKNGNSKLKREQVEEIRKMRSEDVPRKIVASKFGISTMMVSLITSGKNWK